MWSSALAVRRLAPRHGVRILLGLVILSALVLRLYGLNWDEGALLHPDERKLLMVASALRFPWADPARLLAADSPWNPSFFSYGSLPIYLWRAVSALAGLVDARLATAGGGYLLGRGLSALCDVGTVALTYALGRRVYDRRVGLLGAVLVAVSVLHIQLAHFYAVDTLLTLLVMATLLAALALLWRPTQGRGLALGGLAGLALATKLSAYPLALVIVWAWVVVVRRERARKGERWAWRPLLAGLSTSAAAAAGAFLLAEPYALLDISEFLSDVSFEASMAGGLADAPYTRQYAGTLPYLYPLWQLATWSLGPPLGAAALGGLFASLGEALSRALRGTLQAKRALPLGWVVLYLALTGGAYAKFARYMLPVVPLLCLLAARLLLWPLKSRTRGGRIASGLLAGVVLAASAVYALAFVGIYGERHAWLEASDWICRYVPSGSTLLVEHWDDALPVAPLGAPERSCAGAYVQITLPLYEPDTPEKTAALAEALANADYLVLSSHRLYTTISRLPARYPATSRYYDLHFAERLGYRLVHATAVYPRVLGLELRHDTLACAGLSVPTLLAERLAARPGLTLGFADESLTVYDHPMPLIFQRVEPLSAAEIHALLVADAQDGGGGR